MTREEQIRQAAETLEVRVHSNPWILFEKGAEWADANPNWISVEDELPEVNTAPLVRIDLSDRFEEETILYDVIVFNEEGFHTPYNVTHWMPIISPRKEE